MRPTLAPPIGSAREQRAEPERRFRDLRPERVGTGRGLRPHRHHLPPRRPWRRPHAESGVVRIAFDRPEVLNAFRPHTVDELYRALDHARMTPDVGVVLLTGNGPSPEGRQVGLLLRRRPAHPRSLRLPVRRGRDRRHRRRGARQGPGRPPAHPRGAAPHPHDAEGRHRRRQRLGGRRRALPARRLRPDHRQPRARPLQADRRRRRQLRRRLRQRLPRQDGRPEVRPRDLLPRPHLLRRGHAADGRRQHRRRPRRPRARGAAGRDARSWARARRRSGC